MKSILKTSILSLLTLACGLCASAVEITPSSKFVTRKVTSGPFDAVRTNTSIDLIYTQGPQDITIYAPDNLMKYVKVAIKGKEIVVSYSEQMTIRGKANVQVRISGPDVARFTTASAGDIYIKSDLVRKGKEVKLNVLSAGDIKARKIEAETVTITTGSAGDIETGDIKADNVNIIANSAGDIETGKILARIQANVRTNSAGDIEMPQIIAGDKLSIITNSAGDIEIDEASAENVAVHANSAGDVKVKKCNSTNLSASCNSSGYVEIAGITDNASYLTSSSGDVKAKGMKANNVSASIRSVGSIDCYALKSLSASVYGNGMVRYAGKPTNISIQGSKDSHVKPL